VGRSQDEKQTLTGFLYSRCDLLGEVGWHGEGYHGRWWRQLGVLWRRLRAKRERWVAQAVLSGPLHGPKPSGARQALTTKRTHLVVASGEITLSVTAATEVAIAIATTSTTAVAPVAAAILGLIATEGALGAVAEPPVTVPKAAPAKVTTPPTPRIPIPTVVLVAASAPPSTAWREDRERRGEGGNCMTKMIIAVIRIAMLANETLKPMECLNF